MNPTNEQVILKNIEELEKIATDVLSKKRSVIPRRPIVIEFCGAPKSGKSSCINSLDLFLRRNKFRTKVLTERASVCPVKNKFDPYFNIWTVTSVIAELTETLANSPKDFDVIILDRGIFDALCWFTWLLENNHLDDQNYKGLTSFLTLGRWRSVIDLVYVFTADESVSLDREYANLLTRKVGSIMRPEVLVSYKLAIKNTIAQHGGNFRRVEMFDTSNLGISESNFSVTKKILDILNHDTSERIGYVAKSEIKDTKSMVFNFQEAMPANIVFNYDVRDMVEADSSRVQPIPIVVVTNKERNKVLVVKKSKNTTSTKSPESEKLLLYLGGHVREEDSYNSDDHTIVKITKFALNREFKEETGVDYYPLDDENPLCFWVKNNERSIKHIAICHILEANTESIKINLDSNEFISGGSSKSGKFIPVSEISDKYDDLEDWSKIIGSLSDRVGNSSSYQRLQVSSQPQHLVMKGDAGRWISLPATK